MKCKITYEFECGKYTCNYIEKKSGEEKMCQYLSSRKWGDVDVCTFFADSTRKPIDLKRTTEQNVIRCPQCLRDSDV